MNRVLIEDINNFKLPDNFIEQLKNCTIMITGATGLLGSICVKCLQKLDVGIKMILPVRNIKKADAIFSDNLDHLTFIEGDLIEALQGYRGTCDYAIHFASPTNGKYMTDHPVETFELALNSTIALLNLCKKSRSKSCVYISSLEYYGENHNDELIDESFIGKIDYESARSSYPLSKRAAEYMSRCYALEYGVPVKIARLTQTFGAGISEDDNRVFAQFARSIIVGDNIELHTDGLSSKPYCYTMDCISAIIYILLKGENGEAYNVATPDTYISIYDMAIMLRAKYAPDIEVVKNLSNEHAYAPYTKLNLSSEKLLALGWCPKYDLIEMYDRLITSLSSTV